MVRRTLVLVAVLFAATTASAKVGSRDFGGYVGTDSRSGTPNVTLPAFYLNPSPSPSPNPAAVDVTIADSTALKGQDDAVFSIQTEMNNAGTVRAYGTVLNNCFAHTNGIVTCQQNAPVPYFDNTALPDNRFAGLFVFAPFWDDLIPSATSTITIERSTGNYFWVQWTDFAMANDPAARLTFRATFQVNAAQGAVLYQYFKMTGSGADGSSATIGIQHSSSFIFNQYSFNTAVAVATGAGGGNALQAILFDIDADGDRISADLEKRFGTSDSNHDTDGGGQDDGCEIANGKDPNNSADDASLSTTDADGDTLTSAEEAFYGTNPASADSDGDSTMTSSLKDNEELYGLTGGFHTDPTKADTDNDGFNDGVEIDAGTSPLNPTSHPALPEKDLHVTAVNKYHARAAVDAAGKVHIVAGRKDTGGPVGVYYYMTDADGTVRIPETLLKSPAFTPNISARHPTIQVFNGKVYITYLLYDSTQNTSQLIVLTVNPANAPQDGTPVLSGQLVESQLTVDTPDVIWEQEVAVGGDGIHIIHQAVSQPGSDKPRHGFSYKHLAFDGTVLTNLTILQPPQPKGDNRGGLHRASRARILVDSDGTVHLALVAKSAGTFTYYASIKNGQLAGPYFIGTIIETDLALTKSGNLLYIGGGGGGGDRGGLARTESLAILDPRTFSVVGMPKDRFGVDHQIDPASMVLPLTSVYNAPSKTHGAGLAVLANGAILSLFLYNGSNGLCLGAFAPTGASLGDPLCFADGVPTKGGGQFFDALALPNGQLGFAYTKGNSQGVFYASTSLAHFNFVNIPMPPAMNDAPVITSTPGQFGGVGVPYSYMGLATDATPAGGALTWSLVSGPTGLTVSPAGAVAWTPNVGQIGNDSVVIQVCDTGAPQRCTSQSFVVVVSADQPPVITSIPGTTAIAGKPYSYQVIATDAVSTIAAYNLVAPSPAPGNMALSASGLLTWTPTSADVGSSNIQLKVTDAAMLSAVQSFTLTVLPSAPYFTSIPQTTAVQGVPYSYQAVAVDPNNPAATFSYTLTSTPSGNMSITTDGTLTWTPSGKEHGSINVSITAESLGGDKATQSFSIGVLSQNVESSSGCGCTVGEAGGRTGEWALLLVAMGAFLALRRRRRA